MMVLIDDNDVPWYATEIEVTNALTLDYDDTTGEILITVASGGGS